VRVLVTGGGGQVATALAAAAPARHQVTVEARAQLDIADRGAVERALADTGAEWLVNAAAYTAVDAAEDHRAEATAVNDAAVGVLAAAAGRARCRLLQLSTDFVFDGESSRPYAPDDPVNPLSVYGASKLAGERRALESGDAIVLRTAWVYAAAGRNFVLTMLRLMRERESLSVVCDQIGAPTWAASVAAAIWALIDRGPPGGIHHWTDLGVASWYDFAVAIQDEALPRKLLSRAVPIHPIPSSAYPARARRPAFSVLDTANTRGVLGAPARHWRHNLRAMLDELRTA
jgi:dTDP-4-dehydrorhamnose reductase